MNTVNNTWTRLFTCYANCPAVAPAWYINLVENGQPNTGNVTVDASIMEAWKNK